MGFLICDPCVARPELLRDRFWSQAIPAQLPYTRAAETFKKEVKGYLLAVRNFDIDNCDCGKYIKTQHNNKQI